MTGQSTSTVAPTADEVFGIVRDAVAAVLERDPGEIRPETGLRDLDADSLALVEVAEIVEERLGARTGRRLHIPDADLEAFRTIGDAVSYAVASVG